MHVSDILRVTIEGQRGELCVWAWNVCRSERWIVCMGMECMQVLFTSCINFSVLYFKVGNPIMINYNKLDNQ